MRISRRGGDWFKPAPMPRPQQEELAEILHELADRRAAYGRLMRTDDLREPLLELYPGAHRVRVEFELMRFDDDHHVRAEVEAIEFAR